MYRLINQRYDKIGEDTEALLTAEITKLGAHQASNIRDLSDKLIAIEAAVEAYEQKLGKEPDKALLGSVLVSVLDPQTKREFVNLGGIICKYDIMKERIVHLAGECGPKPTDVGTVQTAGGEQSQGDSMMCVHCSPSLDEVRRRINPEIICWSCNKKGHSARACPEKSHQNKGRQKR